MSSRSFSIRKAKHQSHSNKLLETVATEAKTANKSKQEDDEYEANQKEFSGTSAKCESLARSICCCSDVHCVVISEIDMLLCRQSLNAT